jgi:hypothetical protein
MNRIIYSLKLVHPAVYLCLSLACRGASAQDEFEGWNLEPSVAQAHLVMVARVASFGRLTVVEGAKTDVTLREYRFQPIRRLKGIFQRDQLSMTAADLGCASEDGASAPPLKEGEFRLLILTQPQGPWAPAGCVAASPGAASFGARVPLLSGPDDPLVSVVETLIRVSDARSRHQRSSLLVERLQGKGGIAAVPLLMSLRPRAGWAAADARTLPALARLVRDPSIAVRNAALDALRDVLACRRMPDDPRQLDAASDALRGLLESKEPVTSVRLTALEALGHLLVLKSEIQWPREFLVSQLTGAKTHAERAVAATALTRIVNSPAPSRRPQPAKAVLEALAALPLDEDPARVSVYIAAALELDRPGAEGILLDRLERAMRARQPVGPAIEALGQVRSKACLPLLLAAADAPSLSPAERYGLAKALGRLRDDRAVPVLAVWLRSNDYNLKENALAALENLDSLAAAREARPMLRTEAFLPYKLRIARLLARHGMADGYSLASEHLADGQYTAEATLVLAALDDPRTSKDLSAVLAGQPDRRWKAAALTGLVATGDASARRQLLEILGDERNPLVADAAQAAGLAGDAALLRPFVPLVQSRNRQVALASIVALRRFLTGVRNSPRGLAAANDSDDAMRRPLADVPAETLAALASAVDALIVDANVDLDLRQEAFAVAQLLKGAHYARMLAVVADQVELEGTPLSAAAETEMRRQRLAEGLTGG